MSSWLNLGRNVAIVTGAGSGIGRSICKNLASAGCAVVACDLMDDSVKETARQIAESDDKAIAYPFKADVSSSADVEKLFYRASEMSQDLFQQPPSILVNCAGITRDGWISNLTEGEFDDVINVNLKGCWLTARQFAMPERTAGFKEGGAGGSIVNISR